MFRLEDRRYNLETRKHVLGDWLCMRQGEELNIGLGWFRKKRNTLDNLFSNYE
jgi:hypothetical protein